MVERTAHPEGLALDARTGHLRPVRRWPGAGPREAAPSASAPASMAVPAEATAPWLLLVFMIAMLIPATFNVAGLSIPPYRLLLMVVIVPLFLRFLQDREQPLNAVDILVMGYILWTGLAVLANHGLGRIVFVGSAAIDQFGAYLVGRSLIRHVTDFRLFFRYLLWALAFLLPFALLENVTRIFPIHDIVALFATPGFRSGGDVRFGLFRAHTVFPHPIHFGLFCALALAPVFYLYRGVARWIALGLVTLVTLTALSSAPVVGMLLQYAAILWERLTRWLPGRWLVLGALGAFVATLVELLVPGGFVGILVEDIAYSPLSALGRFEILEWGSAEVARNPVFGIGFNEWVRPWWRKSSVDNYYLVLAMRYGLPALVLFLAAVLLHMARVARARRDDPEIAPLRTGYLISVVAFLVMISSVSLWGALPVFILTLIGAGSWFYAGEGRAPAPRRRGPDPERDPKPEATPLPPAPVPGRAPGPPPRPAAFGHASPRPPARLPGPLSPRLAAGGAARPGARPATRNEYTR